MRGRSRGRTDINLLCEEPVARWRCLDDRMFCDGNLSGVGRSHGRSHWVGGRGPCAWVGRHRAVGLDRGLQGLGHELNRDADLLVFESLDGEGIGQQPRARWRCNVQCAVALEHSETELAAAIAGRVRRIHPHGPGVGASVCASASASICATNAHIPVARGHGRPFHQIPVRVQHHP